MPAIAMRILVVGIASLQTNAVLSRLLHRGFGSYEARNIAEAAELLGTLQFDVVLAAENLSDGRGYDLAELIAAQSGSLLVAVQLSETSLWLPVLEGGRNVLGERALNVATLEWDLEEILSSKARDHVRAVARRKTVLTAGSPEARLAERLQATGTEGRGDAPLGMGKESIHEAK